MSEVQHRPPPRGRGSARGGRGGFGSRGGIRSSRMNGDSTTSSFEDQGEVGQLKRQYAESLKTVREMFPDWTDEDIVFALQEEQGDVQATVTRMSEGSISQWGEVKKKKQDRSRSKVPETPTEVPVAAGRGRGRGSDIPRGSRGGRATDRGGRSSRGRGGAVTNGQRAPANDDWGKKDGTDDSTGEDGPAAASKLDAKAPSVNNVPAPVKPKDTWAALLRPPVPPPAPKKVSPPPAPPKPPVVEPTPPPPQPEEPAEPEPTPAPAESLPPPPPQSTEPALPEPEEPPKPAEPEPEPVVPETIEQPSEPEVPEIPEIPEIQTEEPSVETAPQPLTEQNLEKVEDVAPAAPTGTQASTVNSSVAPARVSEVPTPSTPRARHVGLSTPKIGSARTASFTRRTLEQQEAVIMPGNHAIDRTTVQFGSLGLNGAAIDDDDYEPEPTPQKPETVAQPPPSPPAQPVTALPPVAPQTQVPQQAQPVQAQVQSPVQPQVQQPIQPPVQQHVQPQIPSQQQPQPTHQEALPTPRQAPGLPAQPQVQAQVQHQQQPSPQPPVAPQSMTSQHMNPQLSSQFNRFGGIEQTQAAQKPYDSFQQHVPQQHTPQTQAAQLPQVAQSQQAQQQSYGYPTHHQQQQHHQQSHPAQAGLGGLSSLPEQYNYYNSEIQRAGAPGFNYYTNPYSQPTQDTVATLPRASSGMGSAAGETPSQLPTAPSQSASRFSQVGEQTSAHGTPSPGIPTLQPTSQAPNPQQTAAHQQYPMQPYYHPGYYYMNQVFNYDAPYSGTSELSEGFSSYQQFYPTYQTPFAKQQGLYTQPHQNFQYSDHTSSPAGLGGFGGPTTQGRDSGTGVSDYGRGAVSQTQQSHPQHSSANFAGLPNFLNSRGLPEQQLGSGVGQQQVAQQGQSDDNLKPFGDSKPPTGPASNSGLQGQPRPGSATSGATNLPQQGSQPQGGMGYPHNLNHHLHGHQAHQQSQHSAQGQGYGQYSMYGQYPSQYQATNSRQGASGWGGQYGGH